MEQNKIIKIITNEQGKGLISAKELYDFLEIQKFDEKKQKTVGTDFAKWFKRMCEYGFVENTDFTLVRQKCPTNNPKNPYTEINDYAINIDMAKELSMIQRTDKGKEARQYFIACESKLKEVTNSTKQLPIDYISALKALITSEEEKALMQPKVEYYENVLVPNTYVKMVTTTAIAKDLGKTAQALNKELHELKIIYKGKDKSWYLYKEYEDKIPVYCDYIINEHGQTLKWTEKGREWIIRLLKSNDLKVAN